MLLKKGPDSCTVGDGTFQALGHSSVGDVRELWCALQKFGDVGQEAHRHHRGKDLRLKR